MTTYEELKTATQAVLVNLTNLRLNEIDPADTAVVLGVQTAEDDLNDIIADIETNSPPSIVSVTSLATDLYAPSLYGADSTGAVWRFSFETRNWTQV